MKKTIPWLHIRHAEWVGNSPRTMKLHRFDGDIYLDVPSEMREQVEAFITEKTEFGARLALTESG